MKEIKYCQHCGKIISRLDNADYYSHISVKYCNDCAVDIKREKTLQRVNAFRHRKRQKDKYKDEQLELLKQENDLLRERLKELRLNHKVVC